MIEQLVEDWLDKYSRWHYKSEASKALVGKINQFILENPQLAYKEAKAYHKMEEKEAEALRKQIREDILA